MEFKPTNPTTSSSRKEDEMESRTIDDFGQPEITKPDNTHQGTTPETAATAHYRADTDAGQQSLHHTLGPARNQAAPGNHNHDGTTSGKLGLYGFSAVVGQEGKIVPTLAISGSRSTGAAVASIITMLKTFIDFTDNTTA